MRIFIIVFILFMVVSCHSEKGEGRLVFSENHLPSPIKLTGIKHEFNLDFVLNPREVILKNNYLILAERKNIKDEKIHLIDVSSLEYIRSLGKDGMGPGEITMGYPLLDNGQHDNFWVYDQEQFKFSKFMLDGSCKLAEHQFKGLEVPNFITAVDWASEITLLVNLVDGWTKYLELTIEGDTVRSFGDWKDMLINRDLPNGLKPEDFEANLTATIHQGVIRGNQSKSIFIKAGMIVDYIDIINIENEEIKTIYGPVDEFPDLKITHSMGYQMPGYNYKTLTNKYLDAFAGEESFFVLYSGKSYAQISDATNLNRIFNFDYEGNILNHYQLDFPLIGFTVDESNRKIYGVTVDEDPGIVEFSY